MSFTAKSRNVRDRRLATLALTGRFVPVLLAHKQNVAKLGQRHVRKLHAKRHRLQFVGRRFFVFVCNANDASATNQQTNNGTQRTAASGGHFDVELEIKARQFAHQS